MDLNLDNFLCKMTIFLRFKNKIAPRNLYKEVSTLAKDAVKKVNV